MLTTTSFSKPRRHSASLTLIPFLYFFIFYLNEYYSKASPITFYASKSIHLRTTGVSMQMNQVASELMYQAISSSLGSNYKSSTFKMEWDFKTPARVISEYKFISYSYSNSPPLSSLHPKKAFPEPTPQSLHSSTSFASYRRHQAKQKRRASIPTSIESVSKQSSTTTATTTSSSSSSSSLPSSASSTTTSTTASTNTMPSTQFRLSTCSSPSEPSLGHCLQKRMRLVAH